MIPPTAEVATVASHGGATMRFAVGRADGAPEGTLVLLAGGGGHLNLDAAGCPRALKGNFLVRSLTHFHSAGFATALGHVEQQRKRAVHVSGPEDTFKLAGELGQPETAHHHGGRLQAQYGVQRRGNTYVRRSPHPSTTPMTMYPGQSALPAMITPVTPVSTRQKARRSMAAFTVTAPGWNR